jgi:hypothetical protein
MEVWPNANQIPRITLFEHECDNGLLIRILNRISTPPASASQILCNDDCACASLGRE